MNVTIKHVAERAGVSTATVSRVINNDTRISLSTRGRVEKAIAELGYRVNTVARSLKSKRTLSIGLLAPEFANDFFMRVAEGVEDRLAEAGYSMILVTSRESLERERSSLDLLIEKQVDGVIIIPTSDRADYIEHVRRDGTPVVLVDRLVANYHGDAILVDNEDATYAATRRLVEAGRKNFGFIGGQSEVTTAAERYAGFLRALEEFSCPVDSDHVCFGDFDEDSGYRLMEEIMATRNPPDTIVLANYFSHIGALRYISTHREKMPATLILAAFDDTKLSSMVGIPSINIAQPVDQLGRRAAERLLERIAGDLTPPGEIERLRTTIVEYNFAF